MNTFFALLFMTPIFGYIFLRAYDEFSYEIELSTGKFIQGRRTGKIQSTMELEFPGIVEVFAILISAGMSPSAALEKIAVNSQGEIANVLAPIIEEMRNGLNFVGALDALTKATNLSSVRRFADSLIIASQRGTPLSEVVGRQVAEIRNHQRLKNLERAGKAEIALMIPVVFLILPVSILFALWPSFFSLNGVMGS